MPFDPKFQLTTPSDREIVLSRTFDAPRHLVYEAMTKAEFVRRWMLGPPGWEMVVCENDLRPGGVFRHVWRHADGMEMAMSGVYHEVLPPQRVVRTERFEFGCDAQAGEQLGTLVLSEEGARTRLTITIVYPNKEARDATIASGMEQGVAASYDRLDEVLADLRASLGSPIAAGCGRD